jgi:hypothetical protein
LPRADLSSRGVEHLCEDFNSVARFADGSVHQAASPQFGDSVPSIPRNALESEYAAMADHVQAGNTAKSVNDVVRDPVAEIALFRIVALINWRKNGYCLWVQWACFGRAAPTSSSLVCAKIGT